MIDGEQGSAVDHLPAVEMAGEGLVVRSHGGSSLGWFAWTDIALSRSPRFAWPAPASPSSRRAGEAVRISREHDVPAGLDDGGCAGD